MTPPRYSPRPATDRQVVGRRRLWWAAFALLTIAGSMWALSTPLMTGPDESSHAVRAAAVARSQLAGGKGQPLLGSKNVFVPVRVPDAYRLADAVGACFVGKARTGGLGVQRPNARPACPAFAGHGTTASVDTLQYRGQPTYYAVVGVVTLALPGAAGVYGMRLVSSVLSAAFLASALLSARRLALPRLVSIGVLVTITPVVLYLSGSVNTSGLEVAASSALWVAGAVLVSGRIEPTGRDVARFGTALVVLVATRGLGPGFAITAIVALGVLAGRDRTRSLWKRRDVRLWAMGSLATLLAAGAWLAYIQAEYPLSPRPGSGFAHALGLLPFYLEQTVGAFGVNDTVLPVAVDLLWATVAAVLLGLLLIWGSVRERLVVLALLAAGLVVQVSAEGLSLPPIGYFWQGRYAMPLLVGVPILSAGLLGRGHGSSVPNADTGLVGTSPKLRAAAVSLAAEVFVVVHVIAFWSVVRHHAAKGAAPLSFMASLTKPRWEPPLVPLAVYLVGYAASCAALAWLVLGRSVASGGTATSGSAATPASSRV